MAAGMLSEAQALHAIAMIAGQRMSRDEIVEWLKSCYVNQTERVPCDEAVRVLWHAGLKIEAIKLHRSKVPGRGLKDAKDDCEAIV